MFNMSRTNEIVKLSALLLVNVSSVCLIVINKTWPKHPKSLVGTITTLMIIIYCFSSITSAGTMHFSCLRVAGLIMLYGCVLCPLRDEPALHCFFFLGEEVVDECWWALADSGMLHGNSECLQIPWPHTVHLSLPCTSGTEDCPFLCVCPELWLCNRKREKLETGLKMRAGLVPATATSFVSFSFGCDTPLKRAAAGFYYSVSMWCAAQWQELFFWN